MTPDQLRELDARIAEARGWKTNPPDPTAAGEVVEAAVRFVALHERAKALRKARYDMLCEREIAHGRETGAYVPDSPTPCWKDYRHVAPDDVEPLPRDEWCARCLKRQEIHDEYRKVTASRGAALRVLTQRVRARGGES